MFKHFNLLFKIALFVIPFISITFLSFDTYATRVEVDVNNLTYYFSSRSPYTTVYDSYINNVQASVIAPVAQSTILSETFCDDLTSVFVNVVYGQGFSSFVPSSNDYYKYISGSYNNGIIWRLNNSSVNFIPLIYSSSSFSAGDYYFESITLGCSEEEVAESTATPTPTATATATATPTATADEINPDDYEYNAVEDSIVKYRFISFIVIVVAGLLLYHVIIKRIILK